MPGAGDRRHRTSCLAKPELRRSRRFALSARRYAGGMALVQELRRAALWRRGWERLPKRKRPACQRWQRQLSARRDIRHPIQGIACRRWLENGATNAASCIPARRRVSARPTAGHTRPMAAQITGSARSEMHCGRSFIIPSMMTFPDDVARAPGIRRAASAGRVRGAATFNRSVLPPGAESLRRQRQRQPSDIRRGARHEQTHR